MNWVCHPRISALIAIGPQDRIPWEWTKEYADSMKTYEGKNNFYRKTKVVNLRQRKKKKNN